MNSQEGDDVCYRIFFNLKDFSNIPDYENKIKLLNSNRFEYPPYLGLTEFLASIKFIYVGKMTRIGNSDSLRSVCRLEYIKDLKFENGEKYLTELMPTGFTNKREPLPTAEYLIEVNGKPINAVYKENAELFEVEYKDGDKIVKECISPM